MIEFLRTYFSWYFWTVKYAWWKMRTPTDDRALILVRKGKFSHFELGKRQGKGTADGEEYHFGSKRQPVTVIVPTDKEDEYFDDELFLGLQDSRLLPVPLIGESDKPDNDILSKFAEGKVGVILMEALQQPKGAGFQARGIFKWAVLIAIALLIAFLVFHFGFHDKLPHLGQVSVQPTPTPTPGIPIYK